MKIWLILLSLLAVAGTWFWGNHRNPQARASFGQRIRLLSRSLLAGVFVYFALMSIALLYLMATTG
ncbi:hypothetical protein V0R37_18500 [Pollutimonas sp. H1-120]|uniref:hypothetical protein n=1 Tax=Pollutimonas sp. H1-120 TaxID=3148824 RepID=UPI003B516071